MQINDKLVRKLAELTRLQLTGDERKRMISDLNNILALVDQLNALDTTNVEPLVHVNEEPPFYRPDNVDHRHTREQLLKNAPSKDNAYFKVPKVVKK